MIYRVTARNPSKGLTEAATKVDLRWFGIAKMIQCLLVADNRTKVLAALKSSPTVLACLPFHADGSDLHRVQHDLIMKKRLALRVSRC